MVLSQKYQELINTAKSSGTANLQVREQNNVLYIDGEVTSEETKQKLWDLYNKIDPDYRSGDLVMNLTVAGGATATEYEVVKGDSLSKIGKRFGVSWKISHNCCFTPSDGASPSIYSTFSCSRSPQG